jgi:hypothetical protein
MTTPDNDLEPVRKAVGPRDLQLLQEPVVELSEKEIVPATLSIQTARGTVVSVPFGAYTLREGKTRFEPTVDLIGLAAVVMGIGCGIIAVRRFERMIAAIGDAAARVKKTKSA